MVTLLPSTAIGATVVLDDGSGVDWSDSNLGASVGGDVVELLTASMFASVDGSLVEDDSLDDELLLVVGARSALAVGASAGFSSELGSWSARDSTEIEDDAEVLPSVVELSEVEALSEDALWGVSVVGASDGLAPSSSRPRSLLLVLLDGDSEAVSG